MEAGARPAKRGRLIRAADLLARVADPNAPRAVPAFMHGSLQVKIYAPRGSDPQQPHPQDELYVVLKGRGQFACGEERWPFVEGDALFAPAGVAHRFEDFSDDLALWVFFYGPEGGER